MSGYAVFSNELDALLAVNTINNRDIANYFFTARIENRNSYGNRNSSSDSYKKPSTHSRYESSSSSHHQHHNDNYDLYENRNYNNNDSYENRSYNNNNDYKSTSKRPTTYSNTSFNDHYNKKIRR